MSLDVSAVPRQAVGVGRFALDLVGVLSGREDVELTVWCRRKDSVRWLTATSGHRVLPSTRSRAASPSGTDGQDDRARAVKVRAVAPEPRPLRLAWEQLRLPRFLSTTRPDVHHAPHYTLPERARVPVVVTIHDLTFFDHPEWHERSKVPVFRRAIRVAAHRATALLCDSANTAQRLEELCRPRGRVFVVPLGVDLRRFRPKEALSAGAGAGAGAPEGEHAEVAVTDDQVLEALGVREPYVLFLGTLEPRKAVPDLVSAFDAIASGHGELSLVLAGKPGWGALEVERRVAEARHRDRVTSTGYVPDAAVPALLRRAAVVAYPAKEEGFGLPALEALACGAPLVTTSGTVMAELAGDAALTVAPGSIGELSEALSAVLDDEERAERRQLGLRIASTYSWEASAEAHVEAYRWAADHPVRSQRL